MIKTIELSEEIIDFVWELSSNDSYASYPRIKSIDEAREQIERFIVSETANVIACYDGDVLCGICGYYWESEECYAQTAQFLIKECYDRTAQEMLSYMRNKLKGYELLIGFPTTNKEAINYFEKSNLECCESSFDTRLYDLNITSKQQHSCIKKITDSNFHEYDAFHDKYAMASGMYYNSRNLKKDIKEFQILVFTKDEEIHGSIVTKVWKNGAEVFALFIDEEYKNKGIENILINEMLSQLYYEFGALDEILYFINEGCDDELKVALDLGFEIQDNYKCYKCIV